MVNIYEEQLKVEEALLAELEDALETSQECVKPALRAQIATQRQAVAYIRRKSG